MRKALLVLFAVIGLVIAGAAVVIAADPLVIDGMMGADSRRAPQPPLVVRDRRGRVYIYTTNTSITPYVVKRNGAPWVTITPVSGAIEIRDPNGVSTVVVIQASPKKP